MEIISYTADDEEPECNRCCRVDGDEAFCTESCGPEHAWFGYRREVVIKWEDRRKEECLIE